mmetsp:Transcript_2806/g.4564  ORF Transcript_2806/g.4564 Transcript_2806/m.4564 type:complete len:210 (-) Transcript_2806:642-1271(-)
MARCSAALRHERRSCECPRRDKLQRCPCAWGRYGCAAICLRSPCRRPVVAPQSSLLNNYTRRLPAVVTVPDSAVPHLAAALKVEIHVLECRARDVTGDGDRHERGGHAEYQQLGRGVSAVDGNLRPELPGSHVAGDSGQAAAEGAEREGERRDGREAEDIVGPRKGQHGREPEQGDQGERRAEAGLTEGGVDRAELRRLLCVVEQSFTA